MASSYRTICEENRRRYGTEGAQKSGKLAAGLYDNRTHFIFELLQNTEDALGRRRNVHGSRTVAFRLSKARLTLSHFGKPFDEADVRSVCDIAESTKNESAIGRFGLGFKSVYAVTDLPEIHSGDEDFAIEGFVFPKQAVRTARESNETQIVLPLRPGDDSAWAEITTGFRRLGPGALLFLRHIEEISWSVEGGASGLYLRNKPAVLGENVRRITLIGEESGKAEVDQNWLVFHRDVFSEARNRVGRVEVAFSLVALEDEPGGWCVQPVATSPLVVFFPTVVPTNLGFLVQGPYRTTPSRDNIPRGDPWNEHLVNETTSLIVEAIRWMRDSAMLNTSALRSLPLSREKFPEESMFAPIFEAVRQALLDEPLLPRFNGGYVQGSKAKLGRTQELRELFSAEQIGVLFGSEATAWLTGEITPDKEPEIRSYLMQELDIAEVTPATVIPKLTRTFLEAQSDDWVRLLYEFLSGQEAALRHRLDTIPLVRLDDGIHVVAIENGVAKGFLPSTIKTGFPMIRPAVCATPEARNFLISLGISEPDPVDDVVWNLLPKYQLDEQGEIDVDVSDEDYAADIERIRAAFSTDSQTQREKLLTALRESCFVMVVDTGDGQAYVSQPGKVYIATDRLQQLFAGVPDVLIVDNAYDCLRGEEIRDILVSCGASRYLSPQGTPSELGYDELAQIRKEAGLERASWASEPEDFTLRGLTELLDFLPTLAAEEAKNRGRVLWEALADLEARGTAAFYGTYKWRYSHESKTARFDAAFIRMLNQAAWVPNSDGALVPPSLVVFDSLDWKANSFLLTKIAFKPPIIDQLAREAGIPPEILDMLRRDPAIVAELLSRQSNADPAPAGKAQTDEDSEPSGDDVYDDAKDLYGDDMPDIPPGTPDSDGGDGAPGGQGSSSTGAGAGTPGDGGQRGGGGSGGSAGSAGRGGKGDGTGGERGKRSPGQGGGRPFISYLGTHSDDEGPDPDGLDQATRMRIEDEAITLVVSREPGLKRTQDGNPGFDLFETNGAGQQARWVEVKAMSGSLDDRPVGISRAQFDFARAKGDAYWLYVVEHATDPEKARVLRIQNPVAHARTFTFDRGWSQIARTEPPDSSQAKA